MYATELWVASNEAALPPHVESFKHGEFEIVSLGFDPSKCPTASIDPKKAVSDLISRLRSDENSFGVVIGYHFHGDEPGEELRRHMKSSKKELRGSGISDSRYGVNFEIWHADDSPCSTEPVKIPSIYFITKRPMRND
jgi:hypothetical protein